MDSESSVSDASGTDRFGRNHQNSDSSDDPDLRSEVSDEPEASDEPDRAAEMSEAESEYVRQEYEKELNNAGHDDDDEVQWWADLFFKVWTKPGLFLFCLRTFSQFNDKYSTIDDKWKKA